jgi:TRAP-type C4-dicarboxylate transport system permease small subunit
MHDLNLSGRSPMNLLVRLNKFLNRMMVGIAGLFLVGMVGLTCADVILRRIWKPIGGTVELVAFFSAIVTAFALGYTQIRKGHISVDVVINLFPEWAKRILNILNSLICAAFFAIVAWRIAKWSGTIRETGEVTETLRIIYYPFSYAVAFACAVLCLVFITEFLKSLFCEKEKRE